MRRACLSLCLAAAAGLPASTDAVADVYITETNRTESYVLGFRTESTQHPPSELWIGETRIAYHNPGRTFIVDLDLRTFTVVNTEARTYVQSSLPVDLSAILSEDLHRGYQVRRRSGAVRNTGKTEEILGRKATEYRLAFWVVENGEKSDEQKVTVWATTEVDFDWKRIDELLVPLRIILNRDSALREELKEIEGVQLKTEWWTGGFGRRQKHVTEVVEIAVDRDPPEGVYAPPEEFTPKAHLTGEDL